MFLPLMAVLAAPNASDVNCPTNAPIVSEERAARVIACDEVQSEAGRRAQDLASHAFSRYVGRDSDRFVLIVGASNAEGVQQSRAYRWPPGSDLSLVERLPSHVFPHEVGHFLFNRLIGRTRSDQYSSDAPDWLEEMFALACEDEAGVQLRRSEAYRLAAANELIPVTELLAMEHPELTAARAQSSDEQAGLLTSPASVDTSRFYGSLRALFELLEVEGRGRPFVGEAVTVTRNGRPMEEWLRAFLSMPDGVDIDHRLRAFVLENGPAWSATQHNAPK